MGFNAAVRGGTISVGKRVAIAFSAFALFGGAAGATSACSGPTRPSSTVALRRPAARRTRVGRDAQRSASAKDFVMSLGVPEPSLVTSSRGKLDAAGSDESGWVKGRRVDIEVR